MSLDMASIRHIYAPSWITATNSFSSRNQSNSRSTLQNRWMAYEAGKRLAKTSLMPSEISKRCV